MSGKDRTAFVMVVGIVVLGALGLLLNPASPGPEATTQLAGSERCVPVGMAVLEAIATGLTMSGDGSLADGRAVRSNDFESVYFIAARIVGPGLRASDVGIWASNDLNADGPFFGIDGFAHQFTDWGRPEGVSQFDDGAQEAKACVLAR